MLISGKHLPSCGPGEHNSLYIAKSCDLINWDLYPNPIICKDDIGVNQIYRSTGIFRNNNTLDIYFSYNSNPEWYIRLWKNVSIDGMFNGSCPSKKILVQSPIVNNYNNIIEKTIDISKSNIKVYPNPSKNYIIIENFNNEFINSSIEIFDIVGHKIITKQLIGNKTEISLTDFAKGTYSYQIICNNIVVEKNILIINN